VASSVQAHSLEEVEDFIAISSSLLVNMGTLDPAWIASMKLCAKRCVELGKHWVLDPVGAGVLRIFYATV
jgi:hydroxyethylthiazole kinase